MSISKTIKSPHDRVLRRLAYLRAHYVKNKQHKLEYQRKYRAKNAERLKARDAAYRHSRREIISRQTSEYKKKFAVKTASDNAAYRQKNRQQLRAKSNEYYSSNCSLIKQRKLKIKLKAFDHYGGRVCVFCGEDRIGALTIDHINQDGSSHRKEIGYNDKIGRWLKSNNYPDGFRVLCMNCNFLEYFKFRELTLTGRDREIARRYGARVKQKFMALLGSRCVVCDNDDLRVLTAHHIHNDGRQHRNEISQGSGSTRFYRAVLKANNIGKELSRLECRCLSCNCAEAWG